MTEFAIVLALLPAFVALYAYVAYPLILLVIARSRRATADSNPAGLPQVSVVVPAYNEEAQIAGAIDALLAQSYPANRMQILVISDASTDRTDSIVGEYASRGVELLRMPARSGKTKGENAASASLRGEIIVNTDASIRLHRDAVSTLVAHMAEPGVGVASGRDVSISAMNESVNATEAGYVGYEMWIRALETRSGGIVGASGSCYAIRADLAKKPVRDDLSRDFSAALTARLHGYRAVSVDEAICFVPRTGSLHREFRRKVRTISRGMNTLYSRKELLNPFRHGRFAWKLFSHKVCRWLMPVSMLPAIAGLAFLAPRYPAALMLLIGGAAVALLAWLGSIWPPERRMPRIVSTAAFGVSANLAVLYALRRFISRDSDAVWEPTRREPAAN